ncbi:hypothetical protein niasHT_022258 [Heterodera trifolii]|uniref:Transmembrane protein n=1 Tax=Heterodera trifolii TaxID=157864 RepID=A0ABD2KA90_9BILA
MTSFGSHLFFVVLFSAIFVVLCNNQPNLWQNVQGSKFGAMSFGRSPFSAYLSRGGVNCGTKYLITLRKLNTLIAEAHEEMKKCEKLTDGKKDENEARRKADAKMKQFEAKMEMIGKMFV